MQGAQSFIEFYSDFIRLDTSLDINEKRSYQTYSIDSSKATRGRPTSEYSQMRISRSGDQVFKSTDINKWTSNEPGKDSDCYRLGYIY